MDYIFDERAATPLCRIMGEQGSDKGHGNITTSRHNYTTFYYHIFKDMQYKPLRVFELGLGTNNVDVPSNMGPHGRPGASLYGWNQFFPSAKIFGADIDTRILFQTPAIRTYYCDQTKPRVIHKMWETPELQEPFDIIVDDGLHTFDANVCFFENSIHRLAKGGYYIVEDITRSDKTKFEEVLKEWRQIYTDHRFTLITIPSVHNDWDNTLLVVKKD